MKKRKQRKAQNQVRSWGFLPEKWRKFTTLIDRIGEEDVMGSDESGEGEMGSEWNGVAQSG